MNLSKKPRERTRVIVRFRPHCERELEEDSIKGASELEKVRF